MIIAAAGNEGKHVDGFYPACLPGVLAVGASNNQNEQTSFS
ncbi:MAG: type VII secretion-associated serine protease mycosin, partial [Firmicutes bacterium]|nr:type VII secretion-associated serine protease mycosin [Candidatus Fermentithermobacillaceae bacterium]